MSLRERMEALRASSNTQNQGVSRGRQSLSGSEGPPPKKQRSESAPLLNRSNSSKSVGRVSSLVTAKDEESTPHKKHFLQSPSPPASRSACSEAAMEEQTEEKDVLVPGTICEICRRTVGLDGSFLLGQASEFDWFYADGRGLSCKICMGVFRTEYKPFMLYETFKKYIRDPAHYLELMEKTIAYVSLKHEGKNIVQSPTIAARVELLRKVFGLVGVPFPLAQVIQVKPGMDPALLQKASLIPGSASEEGVFALVPRVLPSCKWPADTKKRYLFTNQAQSTWPLHPCTFLPDGHAKWWAELPDSVSILRELGGTEAATQENFEEEGTKREENKAQQGYWKSLSMHTASLLALMRDFGGTKEKEFSPLASKVNALRTDLLDTPFAQDAIMGHVDKLLQMIKAAKLVVKPLKEYQRTQKETLLGTIHTNLQIIMPYLLKEKKEYIGPELVAIYAKAEFFEECRTKGAKAALGSLANLRSLSQIGPGWTHADNVCIDCVTSGLAKGLGKEIKEDPESSEYEVVLKAQLNEFLEDVSAAGLEVDGLKQDFPTLGPLATLLDAFLIIAKAANRKGGIQPSAVVAAFTVVETSPLGAKFREGFKADGVGAALEIEARSLLAKSELDDQCDQDFAIAIEAVLDLGNIQEVESGFRVGDWSSFLTGSESLVAIASESLADMAQVLGKWSAVRAAEAADTVLEVLKELVRVGTAWDKLLMLSYYHGMRNTTQQVQDHFTSADFEAPLRGDAFSDSVSFEGFRPDGSHLVRFADEVETFIQHDSAKNASTHSGELASYMGRVLNELAIIRLNQHMRDCMSKENSLLLALAKKSTTQPLKGIVRHAAEEKEFLRSAMEVAKFRGYRVGCQPFRDSLILEGSIFEFADYDKDASPVNFKTFVENWISNSTAKWVINTFVVEPLGDWDGEFARSVLPTLQAFLLNEFDDSQVDFSKALDKVLSANIVGEFVRHFSSLPKVAVCLENVIQRFLESLPFNVARENFCGALSVAEGAQLNSALGSDGFVWSCATTKLAVRSHAHVMELVAMSLLLHTSFLKDDSSLFEKAEVNDAGIAEG